MLVKILVFILFMAILLLVKEVTYFIWCFKNLKKYEISRNREILLWISLSYILTIIFKGL